MPRNRRALHREGGQVAIEYMGFIPLLLIVGLCAIQLGVAAYAANQAGTAARAAARTAGHDQPETTPEDAGRRAISSWLADESTFTSSGGGDQVTYTARVKVPSVIPGMEDAFGWAERSSTMPRD
ncbi:TadE/TadG family type IV pilus assembly protein [Streptomyces sp. NPDC102409]|uniref:TadE/TadG family type IV pilus assembly protein n=1 Tax=Streptomyces sp. NPDC102409 TaxID=3366172 RepID=UPI00381757C1